MSDFKPRLGVDLNGVKFSNPILTASGCFHYGREFEPYLDVRKLGGVIVKSLAIKPWPGHAPPRGAEVSSGMLNAIGLQNPGIAAFCDRDLPWLLDHGATVVASIVGNTVEEYIRVTDIVAIAKAAVQGGTHGLSVINTALGMAVDTETFAPKLSTFTGGLSGPALKPLAIRCVYQVSRAFPDVPIIGQGGIWTGADVAEFMLAGAWAVAVGTANFVNPRASTVILEEFRAYCRRKGIADVAELRSKLKLG